LCRWETFVDVEELNDVLRTCVHIKVNEDDNIDEIDAEDCDGDDDDKDEIEEEKGQFWLKCTIRMCNKINYNVIFLDKINFNIMTVT